MEKEQKMIEDYNKLLEQQEKKRADDIAKKEAKIQSFMNKMADSVVKKQDEVNQKIEAAVMRYQQELKEKQEMDSEKVKFMRNKRNEEIKEVLDQQMKEK